MLKYGKDTGLPETYRITLALSVAFLAHTLLMATFPFDLPEPKYNPVTVQVQLNPKGSAPTALNATSKPSRPIATPFSIDERPMERSAPEQPTTTAEQQRETTKPEPDAKPATSNSRESRQQPEQEPTQATTSRSSPASSPSAAGDPSDRTKAEKPDDFRRESQKPTEEAYRGLLAKTIGDRGGVSKHEYSAVLKEGQAETVWVDLKLMDNGTLIDAKISKPSGNKGFDLLMYKAALAASPYPEPPDSLKSQRWFSVKLIVGD